MATRTEMDLPAGIREAISTLIRESVRCGLYDAPRKAQTAAHEALVARLLALLAPEPEPSDAEVEAAAEAFWAESLAWNDTLHGPRPKWESQPKGVRDRYRRRTRIALAAARDRPGGEAARDLTDLRERLAAVEHDRWSDWQRWMHGLCVKRANGDLIIPRDCVERWERQINTPYAELSEKEKQSDRDQVDRYWPIIEPLLAALPLSGEPEPSDAVIKYVAETLYRDDFGYDASLIAAGDSDQLRYRHMARIALEAAARAARQTGGE